MKSDDGRIRMLSEQLYDGYGFTNKVGLEYFKDVEGELHSLDPVSLIAHQMKRYAARYVLDFMLAAPFLWRKFRAQDWITLMRTACPRPDPTGCREQLGAYVDIQFLCRYLGADALAVLVRDGTVSKADKKNALRYFMVFADLLEPDEVEMENLDGSYFVSADELARIGSRIVSEGIFPSFHARNEEIAGHIRRLESQL